MVQNYIPEKVSLTVRLTVEAAKVLRDYAGDRNQGRFLSDLIMEQRRRDDLEGELALAEAKKASAARAVEAASKAREKYSIPVPGNKKGKRR